MLVKTAVARKILSQAQQQGAPVVDAFMFNIDSKKSFNAAVDACLLVTRFDPSALYKKLVFRLIGPIEGKPVIFDDTVYFISFESEEEAEVALSQLNSADTRRLLSSMIFWDEKRPIKATILNTVDFEKVNGIRHQPSLI